MFYKSFIESVHCFSFICWYFNLSVKHKNSLQNGVRVSSKVIGNSERDVTQFCDKQVLRKARSILVDGSRVLCPLCPTLF